jgi:hypothetical protein
MPSKPFRLFASTFLFCCAAAAPLALHAQNDAAKVLYIQREFTKPGKDGSLHEKSESAFVAAAKANKAPFHYIAMNSITGVNRTLFFSGWPSFQAWQEERMKITPAMGAAMDKANIPDGDLLTSTDASAWTIAPEYSLNTDGMVKGAHLMEIYQYVIKPGHNKEWDELVKMVLAGYKKGVPSAHFTCYKMAFGNSTSGDVYIFLTSVKSMEEVDMEFATDKDFFAAMGPEGIKKLSELEADSVQSRQGNIFVLNPTMSIPPDGLVASDPDFWVPKPKPVAKKPAQ